MMRKIALIILTILSVQVFPDIQFICYENDVNQNCTSRKSVSLSGFDSAISTPMQSNWYYIYETALPPKLVINFWDEEILEDDREKYIGFSGIDNAFSESHDIVGLSDGVAFYQSIDLNILSDTKSSWSANAEIILSIYAFVGDTKLNLANSGGEFSVSKTGTNLSSIKFGSTDNKCLFSQTGGVNANSEVEFSLVFDTCPITITAVDPDSNTSYQFTSNFDNLTKTFTCGSLSEDKGDKGAVEREVLNSDGHQVGYLIFDFFTNTFKVVDLDREPFSAD